MPHHTVEIPLLRESDSSPSVSNLPIHVSTTFSHCVRTQLSPSITPSLSLPADDLPLSQTFPTMDSISAPGLTPRTLLLTVSSEHLGVYLFFVFFVSSLLFSRLVPCGRLSWLFVSLWAHINMPCSASTMSYGNILNQSYSIWRLTPITTSNAQTSDPT